MRALGWALIHSLWQCVAIAALAAVVMIFLRRPALRYLIGLFALAVMLALPAATFFTLLAPARPVQITAAPSIHPASGSFVPDDPSRPHDVLGRAPLPRGALEMVHGTISSAIGGPRLLPWLVAAWLAGVAFFSLRFAGGFLLLAHRRRRAYAPAPRILALCHAVQQRLGVTRAIRYLECTWLQAPAVIGWLKPVILLPACALTGLSEAQLRAVIAHELAHIRRFDAFVNLFQILVETLLFYHPAIWWLNRRIRAERELCCDEIALQVADDRLDYAQALTLMARWEAAPALAMAANSGALSQRVFYVLGRPAAAGTGQRMLGLTGSVLFLIAALVCANSLARIAAPPIGQAGAALSKHVNAVMTQIANDKTLQQALASIAPPQVRDAPKSAPVIPEPASPGQDTGQNAGEEKRLIPPQADLAGLIPAEKLTTPIMAVSPADRPVSAPGRPVPGPGDVMHHCSNRNVYGIALSPKAIVMPGFSCFIGAGETNGSLRYNYGSCPLASAHWMPRDIPPSCKYDVVMNVQLADPIDTGKMVRGRVVRLAGNFRASLENGVAYLAVTNARVVWTNPFPRLVKIVPADRIEKPAAPPVIASAQAQRAAPPAAIQAASNAPPAEAPIVHDCRNKSVFGQVISQKLVAIQGFTCFAEAPPGRAAAITPRDIQFGACPMASTTTAHKYKCKFDVNLNVRLAYPADAAKMVPGKLVRLGGDFQVWKLDKLDYVTVADAKVLFTDYYWQDGISDLPLPMGMPTLPDMSQQAAPQMQPPPPTNNSQAPNLQSPP